MSGGLHLRPRGCAEQEAYRPRRATKEKNTRGCAEQEAYRPKGKVWKPKNFFVYHVEGIYIEKTVIALYRKDVNTA